MTSKHLNDQLQGLLYKALQEYIVIKLNELSHEKIYAFAVYCDSGCRSMGGAISTIESLNKRIKIDPRNEYTLTCELYASEWKYTNEHYHLFDEVNKFIESAYEEFYEGEFEDIDLDEFGSDELWKFISGFFIKVVVGTMNKLKEEGAFNNETFAEDVFLGIQFGDPGEKDIKMLISASEKLNSHYWHNRVLQSLN